MPAPLAFANARADLLSLVFRSDYRWLTDRVRRHLGCPFGAEDVASEAFAQLAASPDLLGVREPRALLTTIARRVMYEGWRRRELERAYLAALSLAPEAVQCSPEERALVLEALVAVDKALDGLAPKARAAFLMNQLDGLTYAEIGQRLGVSASMVRQYMAKALRQCYLAVAS